MPPSSYTEAYNRALDLESEQKTKKKKNTSSSNSDDDEPVGEDSSDNEGSSKKVRALQKDMIRTMEFKNMQKEPKSSDYGARSARQTVILKDLVQRINSATFVKSWAIRQKSAPLT